MSLQQTEARQESYFVAQLAAEAKRPDVAAPATIELYFQLSYLKDEEIDLVKAAHEYARKAHEGQPAELVTSTLRTHSRSRDPSQHEYGSSVTNGRAMHDVIEDSESTGLG